MPNGPLRLTDDQLTAVLRAAEPLAVGDRGAFLQDVAAALQGQELGDGMVYRTVAQVQRQFYDPPILTPGSRWERWFRFPSRSPAVVNMRVDGIVQPYKHTPLEDIAKEAGVLKDWEEIQYNESGA
jgi:hypothetical protein